VQDAYGNGFGSRLGHLPRSDRAASMDRRPEACRLRSSIARALAVASVAASVGAPSSARADDARRTTSAEPPPAASEGGALASWAEKQPEWPAVTRTEDPTRVQFGLLFIAPATVEVPILTTNPWNAQTPGTAPSGNSVGYGLDWIAGIWLGRFTIELHAGYWRIAGPDVVTPGEAKPTSAKLWRSYGMPVARYVFTNGSVLQPYIGAGAGLSWWSTIDGSALVGPDGKPRSLETAMTLDGMATVGSYIKLLSKEGDAAAGYFFEFGAKALYSLRGDVFADNQLAIVPFAGLAMLAGVQQQ
jgi:hypothetical protein